MGSEPRFTKPELALIQEIAHAWAISFGKPLTSQYRSEARTRIAASIAVKASEMLAARARGTALGGEG